jgi:hypothetical protein
MKIAKTVAFLGLLAMTGILIYGFTSGDFGVEGAKLLAMPWGIVSLVDLYVGFTVFLMMVLGFWTGALYSFIALQTSGGDWKRFWKGRRVQGD